MLLGAAALVIAAALSLGLGSKGLSVGEVSEAFARAGEDKAAQHPETRSPEDRFISLYIAPASVPEIGLSLLGEEGYERLRAKLRPAGHLPRRSRREPAP